MGSVRSNGSGSVGPLSTHKNKTIRSLIIINLGLINEFQNRTFEFVKVVYLGA